MIGREFTEKNAVLSESFSLEAIDNFRKNNKIKVKAVQRLYRKMYLTV